MRATSETAGHAATSVFAGCAARTGLSSPRSHPLGEAVTGIALMHVNGRDLLLDLCNPNLLRRSSTSTSNAPKRRGVVHAVQLAHIATSHRFCGAAHSWGDRGDVKS